MNKKNKNKNELNKENYYYETLIQCQLMLDTLKGAIAQKLSSKDYEVNAITLNSFATILKKCEICLSYAQRNYDECENDINNK